MWLTLRQGHHDGAKPGGNAFGLGWLVALGIQDWCLQCCVLLVTAVLQAALGWRW